MKKIIYGAIASCCMLAACQTLPEAPEVMSEATSAEQVVFTANLGPQSKTYLQAYGNSYKTLWDANDKIIIWDADAMYNGSENYEVCTLGSGAGTTSAEFYATIQADSYVAIYTRDYFYPQDGYPHLYLPVDQYTRYVDGYNISNYAYPMVAVSDTRTLDFQNLCSMIKLSITGSGEYLQRIRVIARNGEPMAGEVHLTQIADQDLFDFVEDGYVSYVDLSCYETLSSDPVDCFITVPAQTYADGFDIVLYTDQGEMVVTTSPSIEILRSRHYDMDLEFVSESLPIYGSYTACGQSYWDGDVSWELTLHEDASNPSIVWFDNLFQVDSWVDPTTRFYGIVDKANMTIAIPFGQTSEYLHNRDDETSYIMLLGLDSDLNYYESGYLYVDIINNDYGLSLDFGSEYGFWFIVPNYGNLSVMLPGIMAYKN